MPKQVEAKINYGKLKKLVKAMAKQYSVKLGLLAGQGGDTSVGENIDLAGLGVVQEYGAEIKITPKMAKFLAIKAKELGLPKKEGKSSGMVKIPARSFLYTPIVGDSNGFRKKIRKEIDNLAIEYIVEYGDFEYLAERIAVAGYYQIQEAFNNEGIFGEWAPNSPMTVASKNSSSPLIDTGRLRGSITYKVEKK